MSTIEELRAKLATLDERIAAHVAECERTSGHAVNPDNEIGGMRNRSARGKARLLARWDSQALESTRLVGERRILANRIAWLEAAPVRDRQDVALLAWWDGLKAGDGIKIGNGMLAIKRKSAASVTLETGTRWTCQELTGLDRGRVAELRDLRERIEGS